MIHNIDRRNFTTDCKDFRFPSQESGSLGFIDSLSLDIFSTSDNVLIGCANELI